MIYFIGSKQHNIVKIGYTQNHIQQRFNTIQANSPYKMEILGIVEGMKNTEQYIHLMYKALHIRGEWYQISNEMLEWLKEPKLPYMEEKFISTRILPKDNNIIEQLYSKNYSVKNIALETNFTISQVRTFIESRKLNIKYKESRRKSPGNHQRNKNVNFIPPISKIEMF